MSTKLTYEYDGGMVVVEVDDYLETFEQVVDRLIVPVFLGATFADKTISKYIQSNIL